MNKTENDALKSFDFCPALAELLQTRRSVGRTGKVFEGLGALSTLNNLRMLRQLMLASESSCTLEIGLCYGGSALMFACSHRDLGHAPKGQHVALDPYQQTVWDDSGLLTIEKAGLSEYLDFRCSSSALELPRMLERGEKFDLIYVDGSHLFEDVFVDAYFAIRLLSMGGIIAFDDSTYPHVAKVLKFLRASLADKLSEVDLTVYRKGRKERLKHRLAHRLRRAQLTAFQRVGDVERSWDAQFRSF